GPVARREDDDLALLGRHDLAARLGARPLLDQQELAAGVVDGRAGEKAGELQGEDDVAVEVLVEAVVSTRLVVEEERRRLGLAAAAAEGEERGEIGRIARRRPERGLPAIRDRRERRVGVDAERLDERRQRRGEILVVADAELVARHVHAASEAPVVGVERDQLGALGGGEHRWRFGVAPLPERPLEGPPVERREPGPDVRGDAHATPYLTKPAARIAA